MGAENTEAVEREQRLAKADILVNRMLAGQGVPSPDRPVTNAEIEAYYRANSSKYPVIPHGAGTGDPTREAVYQGIRIRLMGQNNGNFNLARLNYVKELRAKYALKVQYASDWANATP